MAKRKTDMTIKGYDTVKLRMRRFFALIIDWYVLSVFAAMPITLILRGENTLSPSLFQLLNYDFQTAVLLGVGIIFMGFIYYVIIPTFLWNGQTLGKKICKVKIVTMEDEKVSWKHLFIREMLGVMIIEGGIVVTASYLRQLVGLFVELNTVHILSYIAYGITIISILIAYFDTKSRPIHDRLANTYIVKV